MGNVAEALAIVALNPLATLGMSVCGTDIHRRTAARWGAGRGSIVIGTEVPGRRCHVNEEELLSSSDGSYCLPNLQPCGPVESLHIDLLEDLTRDCSLQEVLGVLIGTLALQLQGLELGQEVVNSLAGALMKTQELGPCPLLVISWEKEGLDLHLQCSPGWPCVCHHAFIQANLCKVACTRAFQVQVNGHGLLLVGGGVMGGCDPDLDLRPPLVKLPWRPVIGLRGCNNFLSRNSACCGGGNIGLVSEELSKGLPEVLLVLDELLDCSFPIHF